MVYFWDVIIVRRQASNHRTSEDDWGVQFSSETKGNEGIRMPAGKQCEQ